MANQLARKPFNRVASPPRYDPAHFDREFARVAQAMVPQTVRTVKADYAPTVLDQLIAVDATSAAVTVTLPAPDRVVGFVATIAKIDGSANAVTLDATINGVAGLTLAAQYDTVTVQSIGTTYLIVAQAVSA